MTTETPPRPKVNYEMRLAAANVLVKNMMDANFFESDEKLTDLAADLAKTHRYAPDHDGYALASRLDNFYGWSPTAEMVAQLDNMHSYVDNQVREAEKQWVEIYKIKPKFATGDRIEALHGNEVIFGTVHEVCKHRPANYSITKDGGEKNSCAIVKFEDTKAA